MVRALVVAAALTALARVHAQETPPWPDTFTSRLEALALIQTLNAEILGSRSATAVLEKWCRDHQLANEPKILAHLVTGVDRAPSAEQRQRLDVRDHDDVKYRRVQLRCGNRVLSEADNWYVPGRLTPEMNRMLGTTQTPFGKAVESLEPYRRNVAARLLWAPLPFDPSRVPATTNRPLAIPDALLEHRAVLYTRDGRPFAEVVEVYQRQLLAFPMNASVTAWCRGQFRPGGPGAFAIASTTATGGRYLVLETNATAAELAPFTGTADLSCYTRAEAEALNVSIGRSETIHGSITPRWNTTVVCGFVDATSSVCWQYSPVDRAFVEVGGWVT